MSFLETIRVILDAGIGAVLVVCSVLAWQSMTARTKNCYRFGFGLIGIPGLALMVLPFYVGYESWRPWIWTAAGVGFAIYTILDRRRIDRSNHSVPRHRNQLINDAEFL